MYWYRVTFTREDGRVLIVYIQADVATDAVESVPLGIPDMFAEADVTSVQAERLEPTGWNE